MRIYLPLVLIFSFLNSFSQTKVYNTTINKPSGNIIIKNGKVTIGQIIVNQNVKTKLYLTEHTQVKDTYGNFRTEFIFKNPLELPTYNIDVSAKLSSPCDTAYFSAEGISWSTIESHKTDRTEYKISIQQLNALSFLRFIVISKKTLFIKIEGVDGITR